MLAWRPDRRSHKPVGFDALWYRWTKWASSAFGLETQRQLIQEWKAICRPPGSMTPLNAKRHSNHIHTCTGPWSSEADPQIKGTWTSSSMAPELAFRATKGQVVPPLDEILQEIVDSVRVVPTDLPNQIEVFGDECHKLDLACPVLLHGRPCKVLETLEESVVIQILDFLVVYRSLSYVTCNSWRNCLSSSCSLCLWFLLLTLRLVCDWVWGYMWNPSSPSSFHQLVPSGFFVSFIEALQWPARPNVGNVGKAGIAYVSRILTVGVLARFPCPTANCFLGF